MEKLLDDETCKRARGELMILVQLNAEIANQPPRASCSHCI